MLGNKNRVNSVSASEQETQQISEGCEVGEESQQQEQEIGQQTENEENETPAEVVHPKQKRNERKR